MRSGKALGVSLLLGAALAACTVGVSSNDGIGEPMIVEGGQFFPGELPTSDAGPLVASVNSQANFAFAGQAGKQLTGDVGDGGTSILMRFDKLGTGYWSVPVQAPDPQMPGDVSWAATVDFGWEIRPGTYQMDFAAMDANGVAGPIVQNPYLMQSATPAGALVISLAWDSNADLDLHVGTPSGDLSAKDPTTSLDAGAASTGVIDRDSNASCVEDGFRQEDAVWMTAPPSGTYLVSVDMFSACGAPSADFVLTVREGGKVTHQVPGRLLSSDADDGSPGLFVLQLDF